MKVALLDLNVLVALTWPTHMHHDIAHQWFKKERIFGWATCPITQSGLIRLSSNPKIISDAVTPTEAYQPLNRLTALSGHQFWSDDIPISEADIFQQSKLLGHRQITDAYLLSLAMHHNGRLITFDKGIESLSNLNSSESLLILKA